jgi:hypothetical protein
MADMAQGIQSFLGNSVNAGVGVVGNPIVLVIVGLLLCLAGWLYLLSRQQTRNPYFLEYNIPGMRGRLQELKVYYMKELGDGYIVDGQQTTLTGAKGTYFPKLNLAYHIPEKYFLGGRVKVLFYVIKDSGAGYPLLLTKLNKKRLLNEGMIGQPITEDLVKSESDETDNILRIAQAQDDTFKLLTGQHILTVFDEVRKRAKEDKDWQEKIMESAPQFIITGMAIMSFLLCMYFVNESMKSTSGAISSSTIQLAEMYKDYYERNAYCTAMVYKYGKPNEIADWDNMNEEPPVPMSNGPPA